MTGNIQITPVHVGAENIKRSGQITLINMDWLFWLILNKIYLSPVFLTFYKAYKLIYRLATETTEIYRVCHAASQNLQVIAKDEGELFAIAVPADIVYRIDRSILYSKKLILERRQLERSECSLDELTRAIIRKKRFPEGESTLSPAALVLRSCLVRIAETFELSRIVHERTQTKYDTANQLHEENLYKLWKTMIPHAKLESRLTAQWTEIGFQGDDPATDFRGMGVQGLDDLLYYAQSYPVSSSDALNCSHHAVSWYPYAIVGINITQYAVHTLQERRLQHYLFKYGASQEAFSEFYCYIYHHFNNYWISHKQPVLTVMDFEQTFKLFKKRMDWQLLTQSVSPLNISLRGTSPATTGTKEKTA